MQEIAIMLTKWKASLCREVEVGCLHTRNKIVHKWKAPWRGLLLRESVAWRVQDLLEQSHALYTASQLLGARILLRSAFETVAVLIHLNQETRKVISGEQDFHEYSERTTKLLLGSRNESTPHTSINILTVLEKADKHYPGLLKLYAMLSECAHPNYEGMLFGYSKSDIQNHSTKFENRWSKLYSASHEEAMSECMAIFDTEYNQEWPSIFEALEQWIERNDAMLETTKPLPQANQNA
ncbi:hypothetical protein HMH05_19470 [Pseudomonas sp. SbB1]|uniref:Uncharacterized protein n=1 Tax=Pseudomonas putida (strain GB-1) TaxID=76869 RepID=B0KSX8_PSEPG|nr:MULTISPECIES: hypothetical protein [Pseudomonas]ABZ00065.1 hypothetical protein PputGB1_4176 [Pseudomonas putida GB-1]EKT4564066.1 hypothetical protein [Pseudomonas putida]MBP0707849.1 hypothetical protein [Pseudomonas sp. T34]MCK2187290.1 hypothetical protein [Pseudomonas sp. MB04B]MDD2085461.1 hypothetical protein [Pseudomonas putida]